ncbi:hypothetical protein RJ639_001049 [Escallonia herrerae]|uniref:Uncharacterized protein n=1 Tax=Escallonia herrerae TaxID=1293975 RepID=A0AA88XAR9_9ASTE|nr:hypothetical protein RJ639_001049 [Escallonia herrerae]
MTRNFQFDLFLLLLDQSVSCYGDPLFVKLPLHEVSLFIFERLKANPSVPRRKEGRKEEILLCLKQNDQAANICCD